MNFSPENVTWLYARAFVDEFARAGVKHVCLCPGSRSTPLAMTFAEHDAFRLWMHLDERACAFFALGLAKAERAPAALLCTSGTAAANFFPTIIEATHARVPLIVLTADRPPELRDTGAPQTIDQLKLYGAYAKWFVEIALPEANVEMLHYARTMACRAVATASESPAGVVHFNMPFREPLVPIAPDYAPGEAERDAFEGRADGKPFVAVTRAVHAPNSETIRALADQLTGVERGLIVTGMQNDSAFPVAVTELAARLGCPILADPLSQVRCGPQERANVIDAYDAFLRDANMAEQLVPQVVLRFGAIPTSKPVQQYLQRHAASRQILVDDGGWSEPAHIAAEIIRADAARFCDALAEKIPPSHRESPWLAQWRATNAQANAAMTAQVEAYGEMFEGRVFSELAECLPDKATLFVSSSMPVRDLDTFFPSNARRIRFLANRGANGIDGVISTALGAGAAQRGRLVLAIGDLAFFHDMNGLLAAKLHNVDALIILIQNDGGGIFSFLPQAAHPAHFEQLFGTPHGLQFEHAANLYGAKFCEAADWEVFRAAVRDGLCARGLQIVQVKTNRERNVHMHRAVWQAVSAAVNAPLR